MTQSNHRARPLPQFSLRLVTAWVGLRFHCRLAPPLLPRHHRKRTNKQTHNKGAYRRNCVLHSRHVDVFNSNGQAYENDWDFPPPSSSSGHRGPDSLWSLKIPGCPSKKSRGVTPASWPNSPTGLWLSWPPNHPKSLTGFITLSPLHL